MINILFITKHLLSLFFYYFLVYLQLPIVLYVLFGIFYLYIFLLLYKSSNYLVSFNSFLYTNVLYYFFIIKKYICKNKNFDYTNIRVVLFFIFYIVYVFLFNSNVFIFLKIGMLSFIIIFYFQLVENRVKNSILTFFSNKKNAKKYVFYYLFFYFYLHLFGLRKPFLRKILFFIKNILSIFLFLFLLKLNSTIKLSLYSIFISNFIFLLNLKYSKNFFFVLGILNINLIQFFLNKILIFFNFTELFLEVGLLECFIFVFFYLLVYRSLLKVYQIVDVFL